MKATKNITQGNIYKNLLIYAVPLMLSSLLSQAYSTVDGMIAGKFISEYALGAISATGSFEMLFSMLEVGFASGFGVYISHLFGKGRYAEVKRDVVGTSVAIAIFAMLISIFSIAMRHPIMRYLQVDAVIYKEAERYFIIYTAGYVILYLNGVLINALHALGVTSFSFYVSFLSMILNVGGNLLMVLVFDMGVAGLAISTVASAAVASVIYIWMVYCAFQEMPSEPVSYRPDLRCLAHSWRYTVPAALQMMTFHGVNFFIAPAINALGAAVTTGYNVTSRLYSFSWMGLSAITSGFGCYIGQCAGEGDPRKIRRGIPCCYVLNAALLVLPVVLIAVFSGEVVSLFFPDGYVGEAYQYAVRYATHYLPFIYVQMVGHVLHAYMRSLARMRAVLSVTILGSVVRYIATMLLVPLWQLEGVFVGQIISWVVDGMASIILCWCLYRTVPQLQCVIDQLSVKKAKA